MRSRWIRISRLRRAPSASRLQRPRGPVSCTRSPARSCSRALAPRTRTSDSVGRTFGPHASSRAALAPRTSLLAVGPSSPRTSTRALRPPVRQSPASRSLHLDLRTLLAVGLSPPASRSKRSSPCASVPRTSTRAPRPPVRQSPAPRAAPVPRLTSNPVLSTKSGQGGLPWTISG